MINGRVGLIMKKKRFNNEIGSVMVLVTVALIVLVGFGALAVDGDPYT